MTWGPFSPMKGDSEGRTEYDDNFVCFGFQGQPDPDMHVHSCFKRSSLERAFPADMQSKIECKGAGTAVPRRT